MSKLIQLMDTDGLALFAVGGLVVTVVVSIVLFAFVLTRKNPQASRN